MTGSGTTALKSAWATVCHLGRCGILGAVCVGIVILLSAPSANAQTHPRPRPNPIPAPEAGLSGAADTQARPKPRPSQDAATPTSPVKGAVTNQPLPRYVSLKASEGNARRGPGPAYRIDWVYTLKGTPLRVTAEYENWRRVEDFEGFGGWIHFTLLSVARTVLITKDMAEFHRLPDSTAPVVFQAERGVLARLLECQIDWCRVNADGQRGWAPKLVMWGVDPQEIVE